MYWLGSQHAFIVPSIPLSVYYSTKVNSCCCRITISVNAYSGRARCIKFQSILAWFPFKRLHSKLLTTDGSGWKTGEGRGCDRCGGHLETWRHVTSQPSVRRGNVALPCCRSFLLCFNNNEGSSLFVCDRGSENKTVMRPGKRGWRTGDRAPGTDSRTHLTRHKLGIWVQNDRY